MKKIIIFAFMAVLLAATGAIGKTLVLNGSVSTQIQMNQTADFSVQKPVSLLKYRFALPTNFETKLSSQKLSNLEIKYSVNPAKVEDETDKFGNKYKQVTWENLSKDVQIQIKYNVDMSSHLSAIESNAPFPLRSIPKDTEIYLKSTKMVQSESADIVTVMKKLTSGASSEFEVVNNVINYVTDNIKYTYNPPQYDAIYTLNTNSGNCQNFAHLSIALLRAAGIPSRIVGGISLKEPWKVPVGNNRQLVQSMGQGGHAWVEIFFPDLGWFSYDPQQTKQFTSTRHVKQTHGLDSNDVNDSWKGAPYLPKYEENIDARFSNDNVALTLEKTEELPRAYILSNNLFATMKPPVVPTAPAPVVPVVPPATEPVKKPVLPKGRYFEFGNMEFPSLVDLYQVRGDTATRVFDKETAEYVTSSVIYAQAFVMPEPGLIKSLSLALHKFGGDGAVYLDLLEDDNGKPALRGTRSDLIFLNKISRKPGYYWVDFTFPDDAEKLGKGKYWIILRRSGEAIMNWFFIPGKPYSGGDDTRSTAKGWQWEDILNYDFVFKIKAERTAKP
jgi:transglutaminase-like putative cysteine protease